MLTDLNGALEVKTKKTYDSWGHEGVCTYYRVSDWFYWDSVSAPTATVYCSDTSSGHGWQGRMNKTEWENI